MASNTNQDWASSICQKKNSNKKVSKETQRKVTDQLIEMFGSILENDIISNVVQNFNFEFEPSIEALILLSSSVQEPSKNIEFDNQNKNEWKHCSFEPKDTKYKFHSKEEFLSSNLREQENQMSSQFSSLKINNNNNINNNNTNSNNNNNNNIQESNQIRNYSSQKNEIDSLCSLKVQYCQKGAVNNSDDDADVVIEEETSEYKIHTPPPELISACQFLSTSTQCPPKNSFPKVSYIHTPSPPTSPRRKPCLSTLSYIENCIESGYKILILMRGAPGSGKSYLARSIISKYFGEKSCSEYIFSADDLFVRLNKGAYVFDPNRLSEAHDYCQNQVFKALREARSPVIVDNTNTQSWEMQQYVLMGVKHGYIIETLEPNNPWSRNVHELDRRNIHNVPKPKIRMMLERYEPNINGKKLLKMFSCRYASNNNPPQLRKIPPIIPINQRPEPENIKCTNALNLIAKEYASLKENKKNNTLLDEDSQSKGNNSVNLLNLGAIGSERKNSLLIKNNNDCTEFIFKDDKKFINVNDLESKIEYKNEPGAQIVKEQRKNDRFLESINQNKEINLISDLKQSKSEEENKSDKKFENQIDKNIASPLQIMIYTPNKIKKTIEDNLLKSNRRLINNGKETHVLEISNDGNIYLNNELVQIKNEPYDYQSLEIDENYVQNIFKVLKPSDSTRKSSENSEKTSDLDISQYELCNTPSSDENIEFVNANETIIHTEKQENLNIEDSEKLILQPEKSSNILEPSTTFGTLFNYIKKSFSRNDDSESENEISLENKKLNEKVIDLNDKLNVNESYINKTVDIHEKNISQESYEIIEKIGTYWKKSNEEKGTNIIETAESITNDLTLKNTNELLNIKSSNITQELLEASADIQLNSQEKKDNTDNIINNLNLITWRESPFPNESLTSSNPDLPKNTLFGKNICDQATITEYFDFNIDFVGCNLIPGYKIINAFNRSINDQNKLILNSEDPLPLKMTLDKSTMTNNSSVIFSGTIFDLEINAEEREDKTAELLKKFPHIPEGYLINLYKNLCQYDFDYAVDHLNNLDLEHTDFEIEEQNTEIQEKCHPETLKNTKELQVDQMNENLVHSKESNNEPNLTKTSKGKKSKKSEDTLLLQQELEKKFIINESTYHPHILRVKRWKNKEPDLTYEQIEYQQQNKDVIEFQHLQFNTPEEEAAYMFQLEQNDNFMQFQEDGAYGLNPESYLQEGDKLEYYSEDYSEPEEMIELNVGTDFIKCLEGQFGNTNFELPQGVYPVIQVRKSLAEELHALWIESLEQQLWVKQEETLKSDEEYARLLDKKEIQSKNESDTPNFKEIMDMEMALATYSNRKNKSKESLKDMEIRVVQQILHEMFPNYDSDVINQIYEAHDRNFDETLEVIEANTGKTGMTMADVLKKRNNLIEEVKKETTYLSLKNYPMKNEEVYEDECEGKLKQTMTYDKAIKLAHDSREEAQRQLALRDINYQKAADAHRSKKSEVALYYADVAKLHIKNVEKANSAAANAFLAAQVCSFDESNTLDLHNLYLNEAIQCLDVFLDSQIEKLNKSNKQTLQFYIITGRGARSSHGQSKIKPAVSKRLANRNIKFSEANPGCLKVVLKKSKACLSNK